MTAVGLRPTTKVWLIPVPESAMVCTAPPDVLFASSLMSTWPRMGPVACGVKFTAMLQEPPAGTGLAVEQMFVVAGRLKLAGPLGRPTLASIEMEVIVSGALPVFVRVTFCGGELVVLTV